MHDRLPYKGLRATAASRLAPRSWWWLSCLRGALVLASAAGLASSVAAQITPGTLELDPQQTLIRFQLAATLHDVRGTLALREGWLHIDPTSGIASGSIVIDATSAVSGNQARDARMANEVLESGRYPEIRFQPSRVAVETQPNGTFRATLHGVLSLHGADHEIDLESSGRIVGEEITARCHFVVPYVQWGLSDPSVFLLAVAKQVEIDVTTTGHVTRIAQPKRDQEIE